MYYPLCMCEQSSLHLRTTAHTHTQVSRDTDTDRYRSVASPRCRIRVCVCVCRAVAATAAAATTSTSRRIRQYVRTRSQRRFFAVLSSHCARCSLRCSSTRSRFVPPFLARYSSNTLEIQDTKHKIQYKRYTSKYT